MTLAAGDAVRALARERDLWEAYRSGDRERVEALVDPLALDVGPHGPRTREELVEALGRMEITGYTIEEVTVRSHDTLEIVTYRSTVDGTYRGRPFPARSVVTTSVWLDCGGRWRLLHRHESPARENSGPPGLGG
jgi:ketosteroid isomerase-like protein